MISLTISYTFENTKGAREEKENEMSRDWPEEISPGVCKNLRGEIRLFLPYRSVFHSLQGFRPPPFPTPRQRPPTSTPAPAPGSTKPFARVCQCPALAADVGQTPCSDMRCRQNLKKYSITPRKSGAGQSRSGVSLQSAMPYRQALRLSGSRCRAAPGIF